MPGKVTFCLGASKTTRYTLQCKGNDGSAQEHTVTQMVARLVLAMLLFPTAGGAFIVILLSSIRRAGPPSVMGVVLDCVGIYLLVVVYWFLLWRSAVRWTGTRIVRTLAVTVLALIFGSTVGAVFAAMNQRLPPQFAVMAGGGF